MGKKDEKTKAEIKQTKKYLKKLTKETGGKMRATSRILKYGTFGFGRNIWLSLASTLVMTVTLLIIFATVMASAVLTATAESMRDKIDITVFLKPGTSAETLTELSGILAKDSNVKPESIVTNTSEEELELFIAENATNTELLETLSTDEMKSLMLATMQATLRFKVYDVEKLDSIKEIIETDALFQENLDAEKAPTYDMNQAEIATISSWANMAKNGGIILGIVFLVISVLVIFNTIRMAIFSRREEIYMMKLIGAGKSFIRGPFLVEAEMSGMISGIIASILGYFGFMWLAPNLTQYGIDISRITAIFESSWIVVYFAAMILLGILIGAFSAKLATRKYLRKL